MKLIKTEIKSHPIKNSYQIWFEYEHGDADISTYSDMYLNNKTEEQIIKFLLKFEEVAEAINSNRCYGIELPKFITDDSESILVTENDDMVITVECDVFAREYRSNYFAAMWWNKIIYFDENGKEFNVDFVKD